MDYMKITHLGYVIECTEQDSWDFSFRSNKLTIRSVKDSKNLLCDFWWDRKEKDAIKYGIKLVDTHVKAMTITPGKG
jgi:hypothetical protein